MCHFYIIAIQYFTFFEITQKGNVLELVLKSAYINMHIAVMLSTNSSLRTGDSNNAISRSFELFAGQNIRNPTNFVSNHLNELFQVSKVMDIELHTHLQCWPLE